MPLRTAVFVLLCLALFALFSALGTWQLERRAWKLELIEQVDRQLRRAPGPAPDPSIWPDIGAGHAYLPVLVRGEFDHARETLVQALTKHGSGYWVMTPLRTEQGFWVLINRGFVDPAHAAAAQRPAGQRQGKVEIRGLLRQSEPQGRFLQPNRAAADRWYSRDVSAIGQARALDPLAPYFIDADPQPNPGGWPIGGLTVIRFRNAHLGYALTWYALALLSAASAWLAISPSKNTKNGDAPLS